MPFTSRQKLTAAALNAAFSEKADAAATAAAIAAIPVGTPGPTGATGPAADNLFFETRAAAVLATIPLSGLGGPSYLRTAGYTTAGDGGHALYRRRGGGETAAATDLTSADGAKWAFVPESGVVRIEQFGGKADWTSAANGTDNSAALALAISTVFHDAQPSFAPNVWVQGPTVQFGVGDYYFASTIDLHRIMTLKGHSTGHSSSGAPVGTVFHFPINTTGVRVHNTNTDGAGALTSGTPGAAQGALIDGISVASAGGTDATKHGFHARSRASFRNCVVYGTFPGDGFHIQATAGSGGATEGNANNWKIDTCCVHDTLGHGLFVQGNDANAGTCVGFETSFGTNGAGVQGCGILDLSGLGNNYFGLNIASYGKTGVSYGGRLYQLISADTSGGSVTPGTNNSVWYDRGVGPVSTAFPAWVSGETYKLVLPIASFGASNRSVFSGLYVEDATVLPHVEAPALAIGGQVSFTSRSAHMTLGTGLSPFQSATGFGGAASYLSGTAGYTNNGASSAVSIGVPNGDGPEYGLNIFKHSRDRDGGGSWQFGYTALDLSYAYGGAKPVWRITTPSTPQVFGRTTPVPHMFCLPDFALVDPGDGNNSRIMGIRDAAPTTGEHGRGEVIWNVNPSAGGFAGWICTTAGTPGTWKTFGAISA